MMKWDKNLTEYIISLHFPDLLALQWSKSRLHRSRR